MENKKELRLAESKPVYEAPRVDVLEVRVERGFTASTSPINDADYYGTSIEENTIS
jgi:hypothetical protein